MKKLALILALVTLFASLSACTSSGTNERPTDTRPPATDGVSETQTKVPIEPPTESSTEAPGPSQALPNREGYRLISALTLGGEATYEGKMREELVEDFERVRGYGQIPNDVLTQIILPTGVIYDMPDGGEYFYDKQTGLLSPLCPDTDCNHSRCVWGKFGLMFHYVDEEHLYFSVTEGNSNILCRCDHERQNVKMLCNIGDFLVDVWLKKDNLLYIQKQVGDKYAFGTIDLATGQFTNLSGNGNQYVYAVSGDTVWYVENCYGNGPVLRTDLSFAQSEVAFPDIESGVVAIYQERPGTLKLCQSVPDDFILRTVAIYDVATDEILMLPDSIADVCRSALCMDDEYVYYRKDLTTEEIAASPLRDFYEYKVLRDDAAPDAPDKYKYYYGRKDGGRLHRMNLRTGEEELVMEMTYNGIPIFILGCVSDGNMLHIEYVTYQDYNNYYNPNLKPDGQISRYENYHYATLDLSTGEWKQVTP